MKAFLLTLSVAIPCLVAIHAKANSSTEDNASKLPVADAHFHLMLFMKPDELQARMEKNNIGWAISAGAIGSAQLGPPLRRDGEVKALLGERFLPAVGGMETRMAELDQGRAFYDDVENPRRTDVLRRMDDLLSAGKRTIAETFPNAITSSMDPLRRRRVATDGPFFAELYKIATSRNTPLPMHMQWHPESVEQLERLLASDRSGKIVLSHCGKDTVAADVRPVLERHPNLFCDLGFRSPPQAEAEGRRDANRIIFWGSSTFQRAGMKPDWQKLIEDFPDRFMVAIDDVHSWDEYDQVVVAVRTGILAQLTPATAEKVAYKNALRLFYKTLPESGL